MLIVATGLLHWRPLALGLARRACLEMLQWVVPRDHTCVRRVALAKNIISANANYCLLMRSSIWWILFYYLYALLSQDSSSETENSDDADVMSDSSQSSYGASQKAKKSSSNRTNTNSRKPNKSTVHRKNVSIATKIVYR